MAEGPIVKQGFVGARVRAIEDAFKTATVPSFSRTSSSSWRKPWKHILHSDSKPPSIESLHQQSEVSAKPRTGNSPSKAGQDAFRKKWHQFSSSQHSPISMMTDQARDSVERRSHSMLDLHTSYSGSPHGGRKKYRDYSNLRRISAGSEIASPQPLSPSKQPVEATQRNTDESGFWSESQPEYIVQLPAGPPRKSIAEGLDENLDVSQGQDEASTAWATEVEPPSYSYLARKQSKRRSQFEEQSSPTSAPLRKQEYAHYVARSLPGLDKSSIATDTSAIDNELRLKRTRSHRRQVPDNTMESTAESGEQSKAEPIPELETKPRALTTAYPSRSSSDAALQATRHSLAVERLSDRRRTSPYTKTQKLPMNSDHQTEPEATPPEKSEGGEEVEHLPAVAVSPASKSRQRSMADSSSSVSIPRPLRRVWTTLSTWRLALKDRRSYTSELAEEERYRRPDGPTAVELPAEGSHSYMFPATQSVEVSHSATPTWTQRAAEDMEHIGEHSPQIAPQKSAPKGFHDPTASTAKQTTAELTQHMPFDPARKPGSNDTLERPADSLKFEQTQNEERRMPRLVQAFQEIDPLDHETLTNTPSTLQNAGFLRLTPQSPSAGFDESSRVQPEKLSGMEVEVHSPASVSSHRSTTPDVFGPSRTTPPLKDDINEATERSGQAVMDINEDYAEVARSSLKSFPPDVPRSLRAIPKSSTSHLEDDNSEVAELFGQALEDTGLARSEDARSSHQSPSPDMPQSLRATPNSANTPLREDNSEAMEHFSKMIEDTDQMLSEDARSSQQPSTPNRSLSSRLAPKSATPEFRGESRGWLQQLGEAPQNSEALDRRDSSSSTQPLIPKPSRSSLSTPHPISSARDQKSQGRIERLTKISEGREHVDRQSSQRVPNLPFMMPQGRPLRHLTLLTDRSFRVRALTPLSGLHQLVPLQKLTQSPSNGHHRPPGVIKMPSHDCTALLRTTPKCTLHPFRSTTAIAPKTTTILKLAHEHPLKRLLGLNRQRPPRPPRS